MTSINNRLYDKNWEANLLSAKAEKDEYFNIIANICTDKLILNEDELEKISPRLSTYNSKIESLKEQETIAFLGQFKTIEDLVNFVKIEAEAFATELNRKAVFIPNNKDDAIIIWNEYIEFLSKLRQLSYKDFSQK